MSSALPPILASASPRRRDLLLSVGFVVDIIPSTVEEKHDPDLSPEDLTCHNALVKAAEVARLHPGRLVIGADTLVYESGEPLGKPRDREQAREMLTRLSGRSHTVCTGVAFARAGDKAVHHVFADTTTITFRELTPEMVDRYLSLVDVMDKAGAYAIQEYGEMLVDSVTGSWSNVVGFPMERFFSEWQGFAGGNE